MTPRSWHARRTLRPDRSGCSYAALAPGPAGFAAGEGFWGAPGHAAALDHELSQERCHHSVEVDAVESFGELRQDLERAAFHTGGVIEIDEGHVRSRGRAACGWARARAVSSRRGDDRP